ncbi:MAG: ATP-binding protein [Burkholderiaceae bacterium]
MYVLGDRARLTQVLGNLLNNAAKYTDPGGRITVGLTRTDDRALIQVSDNGIGIEPDDLESLFTMFGQIRQHDRLDSGLGIGLALSRNLMQLHGGDIAVHSDGLGHGSRFTMSLPIGVAPEGGPPGIAVQAGEAPARRSRFLVVDDNEDARDSLAMLLELSGQQVETAADGATAVGSMSTFSPDVVVMDIGMPGLNGYEAARRIRQNEAGCRTVLIALTGWGQAQVRTLAIEAGFDGHLVKPVDLAALMRLVDDIRAARD